MIPIYFRVTRYEPASGVQKAQPVSAVAPVQPYQSAVGIGPEQNFQKSNPSRAPNPAFVQTPPNPDDLHLLEPPAFSFHPYKLEEALGKMPERGLGSAHAYVLAVIRPDDGDAGLLWACVLAALFQCRLDFLVPVDSPGQSDEAVLNRLRDRLEGLAGGYRRSGAQGDLLSSAPLFHTVLASRLIEELDHLALTHGASLIVLEHGRDPAEPRLIMQAHCPVLVLCGGAQAVRARNILVASDGTPSSYAAIRQGINLAQAFGAFLHVFQANLQAHPGNAKEPHEEILAKMNWHGVEHALESAQGSVPEAILSYAASHGMDLIVMGTHRAPQKGHASYTASVIAASTCPVLVVHPYKT